MKKNYTLFLLFVLGIASAQVPNSTFEAATGYGQTEVAGWGQFFLYPVSIDTETGENTSDEIIFDYAPNSLGTFCLSIPDAHTGSRAMFIRNAFNVTQNAIIPAKVNLFNTEIAEYPTGWNNGVPVSPDAQFDMFGFWYKFAPLGDDIAEGKLELFDTDGNSVGKAIVPISGTNSQFQYVYTPIDFTSNETPAFMTISFSMAQEGSTPTFGSTLTIDDVRVNFLPLQTNNQNASLFTVWPTVAQNEINIAKNSADTNGNFNMSIIDANGKTVKKQAVELSDSPATIDVSALSAGVYFLTAESGSTHSVSKFIKK